LSTPAPSREFSNPSIWRLKELAPKGTCPLFSKEEEDESTGDDSAPVLLVAQSSVKEDLPATIPVLELSKPLLPYGTPRNGTCPLLNGEEFDESVDDDSP
jgi:hypothetical protein